MPTTFKPLSSFAPDLGQGIDTGTLFDPTLSFVPTSTDSGSGSGSGSGEIVSSRSFYNPGETSAPDPIPTGIYGYGDLSSGGGTSASSVISSSLVAPTPTTVTTAGSSLAIRFTWDTSVASAPASFMAGFVAAAQAIETNFTNAVTIDIAIGYGEIGGTSMGAGALGESESFLQYVSYASLLSALKSHNSDTTTAAVIASLPATAPINGYIWVTTAQAKALGLAAANGTGLDGYIGLSSAYPFTYNNSNGVAAGTYDFSGVVAHELTEVMGRLMLTGGSIGPYSNSYSLLDLLHYSAPGTRDFVATKAGYFSPDGGVTNGGNFNTVSGGDAADWASSMGNNAYDAFSNAGVVNPVTSGDVTELNAIGWTLASSTVTPTPPPAPTASPPGAVAIASISASLAALQGSSGLSANASLATLTAVGGTAGHAVTYTLGGSSAWLFGLSISGNTGTLSTGAAGLAGATNGAVYALTLSATDTVTGLSSTPSAFDVVVAGSGTDIVPIATLVGTASKATPSFIYGLAGNDTLNGTGMTGKLWIDGGAGADTMTGGSGPNRYLYNAASDSTASAMDVITNFTASKDFIDLTGIGSTPLTFAGGILGNKLGAHSIGIQISGFNTYVYVNTSGSAESLTATNMKIDLSGWQLLGSNNILHA